MKKYNFEAELKKVEGKEASYIEIPFDVEDRNIEVPEKLNVMFNDNKDACEFYESLSYSQKKKYVEWINSAKKEETFDKRIKETIKKLTNKEKI